MSGYCMSLNETTDPSIFPGEFHPPQIEAKIRENERSYGGNSHIETLDNVSSVSSLGAIGAGGEGSFVFAGAGGSIVGNGVGNVVGIAGENANSGSATGATGIGAMGAMNGATAVVAAATSASARQEQDWYAKSRELSAEAAKKHRPKTPTKTKSGAVHYDARPRSAKPNDESFPWTSSKNGTNGKGNVNGSNGRRLRPSPSPSQRHAVSPLPVSSIGVSDSVFASLGGGGANRSKIIPSVWPHDKDAAAAGAGNWPGSSGSLLQQQQRPQRPRTSGGASRPMSGREAARASLEAGAPGRAQKFIKRKSNTTTAPSNSGGGGGGGGNGMRRKDIRRPATSGGARNATTTTTTTTMTTRMSARPAPPTVVTSSTGHRRSNRFFFRPQSAPPKSPTSLRKTNDYASPSLEDRNNYFGSNNNDGDDDAEEEEERRQRYDSAVLAAAAEASSLDEPLTPSGDDIIHQWELKIGDSSGSNTTNSKGGSGSKDGSSSGPVQRKYPQRAVTVQQQQQQQQQHPRRPLFVDTGGRGRGSGGGLTVSGRNPLSGERSDGVGTTLKPRQYQGWFLFVGDRR